MTWKCGILQVLHKCCLQNRLTHLNRFYLAFRVSNRKYDHLYILEIVMIIHQLLQLLFAHLRTYSLTCNIVYSFTCVLTHLTYCRFSMLCRLSGGPQGCLARRWQLVASRSYLVAVKVPCVLCMTPHHRLVVPLSSRSLVESSSCSMPIYQWVSVQFYAVFRLRWILDECR